MLEQLDQQAPYIPIKVDQGDVLDMLWTITDGLPLTGTFTFVVENASTGANSGTGTCTIEDPDAGTVRVIIGSATNWSLKPGKHRYAFRHIVGANERTLCKGEYHVERTAQ